VLQRMDPEIEEVLRAVSHVALYQLDVKKMEWARKDVEGSLFVVKRRSQPRFQFVVLNQRSTGRTRTGAPSGGSGVQIGCEWNVCTHCEQPTLPVPGVHVRARGWPVSFPQLSTAEVQVLTVEEDGALHALLRGLAVWGRCRTASGVAH